MNNSWDISYCGLNCAKCNMIEQNECQGCRGDSSCHHTPGCHFSKCAISKNVHYCFECSEFPCSEIKKFESDGYAHHKLAVHNSRKMKEIGLKKWIEEQPKEMFCPGWKY